MTKSEVKTIDDVEQYYDSTRKIKFSDEIKINNFQDIYNYLNVKREPTFYVRNGFHCKEGRARSLDDFIRIYKYYFPNHKVKHFIKEIDNLMTATLANTKRKYKYLSWCPNIRKYNFRIDYYGTYNILDSTIADQGFSNCNIKLKEFLKYE